jgi:putative oxidoreductase
MLDNIADRLGRYLMATIFLKSAYDKITNFSKNQAYMAEHGMPLTKPLLIAAIGIETVGGLSLATDYYPKIGSAALIVFLATATLIFHNPLKYPDQGMAAMKNAAILGGLLHFYSTHTGFNKHGA